MTLADSNIYNRCPWSQHGHIDMFKLYYCILLYFMPRSMSVLFPPYWE